MEQLEDRLTPTTITSLQDSLALVYDPGYQGNALAANWARDQGGNWWTLSQATAHSAKVQFWDGSGTLATSDRLFSVHGALTYDPTNLMSLPQDTLDAIVALKAQHGFVYHDTYFGNHLGIWFRDAGDENWFVLRPSGTVQQWIPGDDNLSRSPVIARLHPTVYTDASVLVDLPTQAQTTLDNLKQQHGFKFDPTYNRNGLGIWARDDQG